MAKLIEITGKAISGEWGSDDKTGTGIPVLRTTNFTNEGVINYENVVTRIITKKNIKDKFLKNGDIIIEKSGGSDNQPVGRVVYFEGPEDTYLFNNFTGLLRVKDKNRWNPKYIFYTLYYNYRLGGTKRFENKTTGLHNLKTDAYISRVEVRDLSLPRQEELCFILDKIRWIIRNRQNQITKLDELIKSRFVEMFGGIPDDEKVMMIEICKIITDGTHQPPRFTTTGIPFLFVSNIITNEIQYDAEKFISKETYGELIKRTPIAIGDILLSTVGSYGHPAIVKSDKPFCFQRHIAYIKPDAALVNSEYLRGAILSEDVQRQIDERVKGIAQKTLNLSEIRKLRLPLPPMEQQEQFAVFVAQTDKSKLLYRYWENSLSQKVKRYYLNIICTNE